MNKLENFVFDDHRYNIRKKYFSLTLNLYVGLDLQYNIDSLLELNLWKLFKILNMKHHTLQLKINTFNSSQITKDFIKELI